MPKAELMMGFDQSIVIIILVVAAVYLFWLWERRRNKRQRQAWENWKLEELSEENVIREQIAFDQRLDSNVDLPDGIRRKQAYIYRNLMRKWFDHLIAKHGFNEVMARKIRSDWLNYMQLMESQRRSSFLSLESENRNKQPGYEKEAWEEQNRIVAIEDRFAAAIGKEAMSELGSVREREAYAFDRTGQKTIAPVGFHYFPVSINPYVEELRKKR